MVVGRHTAIGGVLAQSLSGDEATRRVGIVAVCLALLGLILLVGTIWWWRSTRAEHPSLAPLEVMSARRWRRAGDAQRARLLDDARADAADRAPGFVPEPVDLSVLAQGDHAGFDDLREIDLMLGLSVPGSLALGTEAAAVDLARLEGVDDEVEPGTGLPGATHEDEDRSTGPDASRDDEEVDGGTTDPEGDDGGDRDGDPTAAIDGGDVASMLGRQAVIEHAADHVRRADRAGRAAARLANLDGISMAEAHDLEHLSDDESDGRVDAGGTPARSASHEGSDDGSNDESNDGSDRVPDDGDSIDPLLQRASNTD